MSFHPLVLPNRVFDATGYRTGDYKAFDQLENIGTGDLETVSDSFFDLLFGPLIHVAHGAVNWDALFVHQNQSLHLGAEGNALDLRSCDSGGFQYLTGGLAHGIPPVPSILLCATVVHNVQRVVFAGIAN